MTRNERIALAIALAAGCIGLIMSGILWWALWPVL